MTPLEEARALEAEILEEMEDLGRQLIEVRAFIAEESAKESDNEFWDNPDDLGGYDLVPRDEARDIFLNGNSAEVFYAKDTDTFKGKLMASLTDDISPANKAHYYRASNENFGLLPVWNMRMLGPILADVYDENGVRILGYSIPYAGEYGIRGSSQLLREYWQKDSTLSYHRRRANLHMRQVDRKFRIAKWTGQLDEFWAEHPDYPDE